MRITEIEFQQVTRCIMPLTHDERDLMEQGEDSSWGIEGEMFDDYGMTFFGADEMTLDWRASFLHFRLQELPQ